jgi:hypothetical protein
VTTVKIAHLHVQGQDMIIVPLDSSFGSKPESDKQGVISELQWRAMGAGLAGEVVPVWDNGGGRMAFIAPRPWHPFFKSLNLTAVRSSLNKELSW